MELSVRLQSLADMVTPGNRVCDVGCDHGYLSVYLVQKGISPHVIAMDVRKGPLSRCLEHVKEYGLTEYIECRLSDGLEALKPGEADTAVCAGMGGRLMQQILTKEEEKAFLLKELILQPQSEWMTFRIFLRSRGYRTVEENMIEEEGKFYPMMRVVHGEKNEVSGPVAGDEKAQESIPAQADWQRLCDRFGQQLLTSGNPVLHRYLEQREELLAAVREELLTGCDGRELSERVVGRLQEVEQELSDIHCALRMY